MYLQMFNVISASLTSYSLRVLIMPQKKRRRSPGKQDQQKPTMQKFSTVDWWDKSVCLGTPTPPLIWNKKSSSK